MPKSGMIGSKKALAATLRTRNLVILQKKAPAATLTTKNTFFVAKKGPAATFTIQKMHFCTDIGARCTFFQYFQIYHAKKLHDLAKYGGYHATLILQSVIGVGSVLRMFY